MSEIDTTPLREFPDLATLFLEVWGVRPRVWRRVQVSAFSKLGGIHKLIQALFGWNDDQSHAFILRGDIYDRVASGEALDAKRERNWRLESATYPDGYFTYDYGSKNIWRVHILLEGYDTGFRSWRYPRCVGGTGSLPPHEDQPFNLARANRRIWRAL